MSKKQNSEEKKRVNRKQWIATALEAITMHGITVVQDKKPYKSFNDKERFFIQECMYSDGNLVMVKVSSPDPTNRVMLKKEAYWYRRLQQLASMAQKKGIGIPIRFPEVVEVFTHKEHAVMITRYVIDDWATFKSLSQEEREEVIIKIIKGMLALPIPSEEIAKSPKDRLLPVIIAEYYPIRARKYLGELASSGYIDVFDKGKIIAFMEKNVDLIKSFPLKLDHGDFHTGNFRYSKDPRTGKDIITLFDFELMSIQNSLSMVAAAANFFDFARLASSHPERNIFPSVLSNVQMFNILFSVEHMIDKLEETFVFKGKRRKDAELVYRLMRIDDCYMRFAYIVSGALFYKQKINKVELDSYKKILQEQVAFLI